MVEPCFDGLCGILNHRSTELLTPLLSITSTGELAYIVQRCVFVCMKGLYNGEFQIFGIKLHVAKIMADCHYFLLLSPWLIQLCNGI